MNLTLNKCFWKFSIFLFVILLIGVTYIIYIYIFFFSICVFFHNHSRTTGLQGKGEGISLTPHYHFHPLHRHLDISRAITAESSPLHIGSSRTRTGNLWFPRLFCSLKIFTEIRICWGIIFTLNFFSSVRVSQYNKKSKEIFLFLYYWWLLYSLMQLVIWFKFSFCGYTKLCAIFTKDWLKSFLVTPSARMMIGLYIVIALSKKRGLAVFKNVLWSMHIFRWDLENRFNLLFSKDWNKRSLVS